MVSRIRFRSVWYRYPVAYRRSWLRLAIADHAKHELLDSRSALHLAPRQRAGEGARQRWGLAMMPILAPVLSFLMSMLWFPFISVAHKFLMHMPQLALEVFEGSSIGFSFRIALQIATPPIVVLPEDVPGGLHQGKYSWTFQMRK